MPRYAVVTRDNTRVGTVVADCFENADYVAQYRGYDVVEYVGDRTLVVASPLPPYRGNVDHPDFEDD